MTRYFRNRWILFGILLILGSKLSFSQSSKSYYYDNEFEVSLPLKSHWSMDISTGYRGLLQERFGGEKITASQHEHLEINHFTNYKANQSIVVSLGLRYRFKELFDSSETDEIRIMEQIEFEPVNSSLPLSHRFRLEQRIMEHLIHRIRYELGFTRPINQVFVFEAATEALYAVSANLKPEAEQRFSIGVENSSFKGFGLGLAFEYRMENYVIDLAHEFFIMTGVSFSL